MALQMRKWPEDLGLAIGAAALDAPTVKEAHRLLQKGQLSDFGAVPMPYATVSYYARKIKEQRQREAQEEEERLRPKPIDTRIDAGARKLLAMLEAEIDRQSQATKHDPKRIGDIAASLKKVRELAKPDEPSKQPVSRPSDPLTAALTQPSPRTQKTKSKQEALAPKPTTTETTGETMRSVDEPEEPADNEHQAMSGVPASVPGPWSGYVADVA